MTWARDHRRQNTGIRKEGEADAIGTWKQDTTEEAHMKKREYAPTEKLLWIDGTILQRMDNSGLEIVDSA
jgi:hypothetical protein